MEIKSIEDTKEEQPAKKIEKIKKKRSPTTASLRERCPF